MIAVHVLNGPNLNLLGRREPNIYGALTLAEIERRLQEHAERAGITLTCRQSNTEGELATWIQEAGLAGAGVVINAGAYTHTSLAIRDALSAIAVPFVEVHVTNVYAREPERRHSMLAPAAVGVVVGMGAYGYELALRGLTRKLAARV